MHPAALAAGLRPHFLDRLPEAERTVGDRELGGHRKSASLQVEQQLLPGLRTLAHTVDKAVERSTCGLWSKSKSTCLKRRLQVSLKRCLISAISPSNNASKYCTASGIERPRPCLARVLVIRFQVPEIVRKYTFQQRKAVAANDD